MVQKNPRGTQILQKSKKKTLSTRKQSACVIPIQDGAPDWQERVVNGEGVGDTVVSFDLDGLYRQTDQIAHYGHQLEVAHEPPGGRRNLQRVAERQMICIHVLRAALVCGDSTFVLGVTFSRNLYRRAKSRRGHAEDIRCLCQSAAHSPLS